jgi:predicted XRE-type DNA-binding protein
MAKTNAKRREGERRVPRAKVVVPARQRSRENPHRGSSVEAFLREEGLYEAASARAIKEVLAWQIEREMERQGISKAEMARLMRTSRSALDRLLDPENESVTLSTLFRAAAALGSDLGVELKSRR